MADALRFRRWSSLIALGALWLALLLYPASTRLVRCALVALPALAWIASLLASRRRKVLFAALCVSPAPLLALFFLHGPTVDPEELRGTYLAALSRYEGTKYVWGGENRLGIDCSGLVRRALIDAELQVGLFGGSVYLAREGALLWFFDASAKALGEEYRGRTVRVAEVESLNQADHGAFRPGDLMVTADGVHTMAYLGERVWIAADPEAGRVIRMRVPSSNSWFGVPARILRWRVLAESER